MFKKFNPKEEISTTLVMKSSAVRGVKANICELYPFIEEYINDIFPKGDVKEAKTKDKSSFIMVDETPLFFKSRDSSYYPTMRLLLQYPEMMPRITVDRGAIKFVLRGADIMCPGITSINGTHDLNLPAGANVAIFAEGKKHPLGIGTLALSTEEIRTVNKDVAIHSVHHLGDQLWQHASFD